MSYARVYATGELGGWAPTEEAHEIHAGSGVLMLPSLRCPGGCSFRVRPKATSQAATYLSNMPYSLSSTPPTVRPRLRNWSNRTNPLCTLAAPFCAAARGRAICRLPFCSHVAEHTESPTLVPSQHPRRQRHSCRCPSSVGCGSRCSSPRCSRLATPSPQRSSRNHIGDSHRAQFPLHHPN